MSIQTLAVLGYGSAMVVFTIGGTLLDVQVRRFGIASVTRRSAGVHALAASALGAVAVTVMLAGALIAN